MRYIEFWRTLGPREKQAYCDACEIAFDTMKGKYLYTPNKSIPHKHKLAAMVKHADGKITANDVLIHLFNMTLNKDSGEWEFPE